MDHDDDLGDHTPTVEELAAGQAKLAETIQVLAATVRRIAEGLAPSGGGLRLTADGIDPSRDPADDPALIEWVCWRVERYELGDILPACWPQHGPIVEELHALNLGWLDAIGDGQSGIAATQWHDYLHRALERIDGPRWRTCLDGNHRPAEQPQWLIDWLTTRAGLEPVRRPIRSQ